MSLLVNIQIQYLRGNFSIRYGRFIGVAWKQKLGVPMKKLGVPIKTNWGCQC